MILAVDIGTCSLKAGILSFDGKLEHHVRIPYPYPPGPEASNFDPLQWIWAFEEALKGLPSRKITAIAISGNGPSLVPCDEHGMPLSPALLWLQADGERIEGQNSYYLPKVTLLKNRCDGAVLKKSRWLLSPPEWLQFRLTGRPTMTTPHESFRPYIWTQSQIEAYGFESHIFPEIVRMGIVMGKTVRKSGILNGLAEDVPVVSVGSDFMAALLGSKTVNPGMVCDRTGTSEGINYCTSTPSGHPLLRDLPHVVEGLWNAAVILTSTGTAFEWYRRFTGQENKTYEDTLAEVNAVSPGNQAPLFFPGLQGATLWTFDGGSFHGLESHHGSAQMGRAVMEAIGYGVRQSLELFDRAGMKVEEMRITGGQAKGAVWNQMKADITGCRLDIPEIEDVELAGCAACVLSALGLVDNLLDGAGKFVHIRKIVEPRREAHKRYDEAYLYYRNALAALAR